MTPEERCLKEIAICEENMKQYPDEQLPALIGYLDWHSELLLIQKD